MNLHAAYSNPAVEQIAQNGENGKNNRDFHIRSFRGKPYFCKQVGTPEKFRIEHMKDSNDMTNREEQNLIEYLFAEKCSCVIRKGNEIRVFRGRGVSDLYRLLKEEPEFLEGAFVADKVVGKAAAALMIAGGVRKVFADVISRSAHAFFRENRIKADFTVEVPHIINRSGTGWCPLEKRCYAISAPEGCLKEIEDFMQEQKDKAGNDR